MTKYHLFLLVVVWINGVLVGRWLARRARRALRGAVMVPAEIRCLVADAVADRAIWMRRNRSQDPARSSLYHTAVEQLEGQLDAFVDDLTRSTQ